jgi:hypothetical protein
MSGLAARGSLTPVLGFNLGLSRLKLAFKIEILTT